MRTPPGVKALPGGNSPSSGAQHIEQDPAGVGHRDVAGGEVLLGAIEDRSHARLDHDVLLEQGPPEAGGVPRVHEVAVLPQRSERSPRSSGEVGRVGLEVGCRAAQLLGRLHRRVGEVPVEQQVVGVVHRREHEHGAVAGRPRPTGTTVTRGMRCSVMRT